MRKNFNSVQMLETGEDCNKFSKSVSYETLVGGTTTTGRGIKQNQRLSEGSADKPLSAVGTLTSLLCNSAKVMEKWLQIPPIFRLVKIVSLVAVLSINMVAESRAECVASTAQYWSNGCYDTWKPGEANNCGDGCTYNYNNGKLTVTATKPDAVIPKGMFSPWYYEPGVLPTITDIEIDGEFAKITGNAFLSAGANISGKDGVLYLKNVDFNTVQGNTLTGTIIISDQVKTIYGQWYDANLDATIILPPNITAHGMALLGLNLGPNAKIYCEAENCDKIFNEKTCDSLTGEYYAQYKTSCKTNLQNILSSGKLLPYPDGCTKMGASGCTKCKNENFRLNDGECDRLRWTPAEAAKVLRDDNTNEVTITFKK